jgi:hypothetical protein
MYRRIFWHNNRLFFVQNAVDFRIDLRQKVKAKMNKENCPWDVAVSLVVEQ